MRLVKYRGRYYAAVQTESGIRRRSLGTSDKGEAERRLQDALEAGPPENSDIGTLVESYLTEKEAQGARSIRNMRSAWKAAGTFFWNLEPQHITREICRRYIKVRRDSGVGDGTIIKELGVVRAGLRYHRAVGSTFELPPAPPPRDLFLTPKEVKKLINAAKLPHLKLFIILAWATAARASALFELTWDRVDFERGQIRLSGARGRLKGRAIVPMTDQARKALDEAYKVRRPGVAHVIEWNGRPVRSVGKGFREAVKRAGLSPEVSPHVLRHSTAVALAESGMPIAEIAQFLGHTDPRVTFRIYARFSPDHLKKAVSALEL